MAADMANKGVWPVAGGWMDQTQVCLSAVNKVWSDEAACKEENLGGEGH